MCDLPFSYLSYYPCATVGLGVVKLSYPTRRLDPLEIEYRNGRSNREVRCPRRGKGTSAADRLWCGAPTRPRVYGRVRVRCGAHVSGVTVSAARVAKTHFGPETAFFGFCSIASG